MNGIEKITARIQAEADAANAAARESAEQEAAVILEEYRKAADEEFAGLLAAAEEAAASQKEQLASAARLEASKQLLITKQELLARAFEQAVGELKALPKERYLALLTRLIVSASRTGKECVLLNAADREAYGAQAVAAANEALTAEGKTAGLTLSDDVCDIDGGALLREGRIEVNASLSSLLETQREELSAEAARILFR